MAAFTELSWQRIDVWAIVQNGGLATIEPERHDACRQWLIRNGYTIDTLDCAQPLETVEVTIRELLHWEQQFGYPTGSGRFSLDALGDGFNFDIPEGGGHFLELTGLDILWQQEPEQEKHTIGYDACSTWRKNKAAGNWRSEIAFSPCSC